MRERFRQLIQNDSRWTKAKLSLLTKEELKSLSLLLCAPVSGNKETLILRLLDIRTLRLTLGKYGDDPQELVSAYKWRELHGFCKRAKIFRSSNKRALAYVLLSWRNRCRLKGQKVFAQALEAAKKMPRQLEMRM